MTRARGVLLAATAAVALTGCGGLITAQGDAGPALPTPQSSFSPGVARTVAAVAGALAGAGFALFPPVAPYRPSEPTSLLQTPRAILQAAIGEPTQGYVVVYQLPDAPAAGIAAMELAEHSGSGFGQTNYPLDTQFHVATEGDTVVFTWWSRERAADDEAAESAFEAIATVGVEVRVVK